MDAMWGPERDLLRTMRSPIPARPIHLLEHAHDDLPHTRAHMRRSLPHPARSPLPRDPPLRHRRRLRAPIARACRRPLRPSRPLLPLRRAPLLDLPCAPLARHPLRLRLRCVRLFCAPLPRLPLRFVGPVCNSPRVIATCDSRPERLRPSGARDDHFHFGSSFEKKPAVFSAYGFFGRYFAHLFF